MVVNSAGAVADKSRCMYSNVDDPQGYYSSIQYRVGEIIIRLLSVIYFISSRLRWDSVNVEYKSAEPECC